MSNNNISNRFQDNFRSIVVICILVFTIAGEAIKADQSKEESSSKDSTITVAPPYCGLYCLYAAMNLNGRHTDFAELLKLEYFSSEKGSSLEDLKIAATDNGLYAETVVKLTTQVLKQSKHEMILHVKRAADSKKYDHFILFLGAKDGKARILDLPGPPGLVPFHELAPLWDGTGLIISSEPIKLSAVFAPVQKRVLGYITFCTVFIMLIHGVRRKWLTPLTMIPRRRRCGISMVQGVGFGFLALMCGMIYHFANDEGLLANADATSSIQKVYAGTFIPKVNKKKVEKLLSTDAVFIDARYAYDYKAGHLEGAINVPINAKDEQRKEAVADITKDARIVMYCQSKVCPYAEIVTSKLKADGYKNISIFKGGWREWQAKDNK